MALQFVLGNSGCGKTEYMYKEVVRMAKANPKKTYLCVVPEQYTMQTQRKLVDLSQGNAIMNIDVLSFQRMAYRIFDELGIGQLSILEETGKNLVLRKVATEKEGELSSLKGNMHRMGYIGELKSLISEFMQYNISPDQLAEYLSKGTLTPALSGKLKDVEIIYRGFQEFLQGHYITTEELLHVLIAIADRSKILKDAYLILDEFTGFTPVQMELLKTLMPICENIWVSLTIDSKEDFYHSKGMQDLFDMPKKAFAGLMELARTTKTEVLEPVVLEGGEEKRFLKAPALYYMEQNIFRRSKATIDASSEEIGIYSLRNPKEELIWTATKIQELVQKHHYRYRDIAVVTGDVATYSHYVDSVYGKYQIPYFLDQTKEVLFHPFIEFVRAICEVAERDFSYDAMMRLLRTGYCNLSMDEIDRLDNYLLAIGIAGQSNWSNRWLRMPRQDKEVDLLELEALRERITEGLLPMVKILRSTKTTVEEKLVSIYTYIEALQVQKQLKEKERECQEAGEQTKAKEYAQVYRIVMDLFDKAIGILGSTPMSLEELREILDAGFEAAKVATIPPGYDSVTIGDIERTRLNQVKVLIFIGVNEGIVPKSSGRGGIISQYERDLLQEGDLTLAPGAREQAFIQKFYLYLNMTKPSERLYLSYSRADRESKPLRPSYLIRTVREMFPKLQVEEIVSVLTQQDISSVEVATDYLLEAEKDPVWYALAKCFLEHEDDKLQGKMQSILEAMYYQYHHDPISKLMAEALYGKNISGSVTRLEEYAKCAYSHFLKYGLRLKEREESGFEGVDLGNLYHAAIEGYSKRLWDSSYNWFNIPDEVRESYAANAMEEALLAYPNLGIYATAESQNIVKRIGHIFQQTIWALTTQVRKGEFVPEEFEISFSRADGLKALEYELEDRRKIQLGGRIDRMDTYAKENQLYIKVIDYKSGNTKFDLLELYYGQKLQLIVYMNAAMELEKKKHPSKDVQPAAMFYYHIDDPRIEMDGEWSQEQIKQSVLKKLCPEGLISNLPEVYQAMDLSLDADSEDNRKSNVIPLSLNKNGSIAKASPTISPEEWECLSEYVEHHIRKVGNEIYQGNIKVQPFAAGQKSGCTYCPYDSICGFDKKIPGYEAANRQKLSKEEILERMETQNALDRSK